MRDTPLLLRQAKASPVVASRETTPAGRKQVPEVPWGEVIIATASGLISGGVVGWYGHRVTRRNVQDTNRLKLTELQKQDIRWAQEQLATGDPTRMEQAIDRLTALLDAGRLEHEAVHLLWSARCGDSPGAPR